MNDQGRLNQKPYVRLVIGEAETDEAVSEFLKIWNEEAQHMHAEGGLIEARLMTEEGGRMIVIETVFATRNDCLRHHCARAYRRFVARTQYLLNGAAPQDIPVIEATLHFVAQHVARTLKRNDAKFDHVKFFAACISDETEAR